MAKKRTAGNLDQIVQRRAEATRLATTINWLKNIKADDLVVTRSRMQDLNLVESWYFKPGGGETVIGDATVVLDTINVLGPRVDAEISTADEQYRELVGWWLPDAEKQLVRMMAKVEW